MIQGLLGKKIGMTHLFADESRVVPVTVIEVGPCVVTQVKNETRDGYESVQIGFGSAKQLNQPARGHLKASGTDAKHLREFEADDISEHNLGDVLDVSQFQEGDLVDVVSTTKGRGFQGAVKRWGFGGGRKTHGQGDRHRAVGSIGAGTYPGRVFKGKKMPGHMGNDRVTARKLLVAGVDVERNLLMVRGSVPGPNSIIVGVRYAKGMPVADRIDRAAVAEAAAAEVAATEESAKAEAALAEAPIEDAPVADEASAVVEGTPAAEEPAAEAEARAEEEPTVEVAAEEEESTVGEEEGK
jgi:large subunit ribosomal protein L3